MTTPAARGFPKEARLLRPLEFQRVQRGGRAHDLGLLVVRAGRRDPPGGARLGLAISRKVGHAVARNHVKRRVREWFRRHREDLPGWDLVVSARPGAGRLSQAEVDAILGRLLARLGKAPQGQPAPPRQSDG